MSESEESAREVETASRPRRTASKSTVSSLLAGNFGKLPPQAVDLEEAVLGALMLEKNALTSVIDILHPDSFYKDTHKIIFQAIRRLFDKQQPIDILTVTNELKFTGELDIVGGPFFITQLTNRVASSANIEFHSRIILQKHIQRELIRISSDIIKDAYEDTTDVFELFNKAEKNLFEVTQGNITRNYQEMKSLVSEAIKEVEAARLKGTGITGIESGFTELDRVTAGWQKSDLVIVAARPGMGKTAFVLSLARNAAIDFKHPVAFFSLEMSSVQLVNRLISGEAEIPADKLKKGTLAAHEWQQLNAKIGKLSEAKLLIDDTPALSIFDLRSKARRLKQEHDIQLIIIDYIQLMRGETENRNGNREQEISLISRSLKSIAKELNVPIIALSQLSRMVEHRGGIKRPQLSDLRESGAIEQDADMVLFIYRPEYYGLTEDENNNSTRSVAEIIIAKHRNGALRDVRLRFIDTLAKFTDFDSFDNSAGDSSGQAPSVTDYEPTNRIVRSRMNELPDDDPTESPF